MNKADLRKEYLNLRNSLPLMQRRNAQLVVTDRVLTSKEFLECDQLFTFVSRGSEISTLPIIERAFSMGKRVACPLVLQRGEMCFITIKSLGELQEGAYGIAEPKYSKEKMVMPTEDTYVLTPGLAFDSNLNRLGYGGGYYDRYFTRFPMPIKVGIGFSVQYTPGLLPCTPQDVALDIFISDDMIRRKKN